MNEPLLRIHNLSVHAAGRALLREVNFSARAGECVALLGPNGAGKSTLLRALSGVAPVARDTVWLRGRSLENWSAGELARFRAVMSQQSSVAFPIRADEVVALGLPGRRAGNLHDPLVGELLEWLEVAPLRARAYPSLSGGEQQRVQLARVLAQIWDAEGPRLLLLDESTSALDPAQQYLTVEKLSALAAGGDCLVVLVCHDLALAGAFASRVLMLQDGVLVADGTPDKVLSPRRLAEVYGLDSCRVDLDTGTSLHIHGALRRAPRPPGRSPGTR
ncbi:hemin importer ATP-binding subunit [Alcanivorax xiamenensis]|uniref:Hemin importer ATP-binding subunit n=1 Tax=Alcanivorax xiamenensis TaxID=1177156 RepID=A0ABQ6YB58_9GAMM|nr:MULTISPECIES: heme ABC transporter ATP-binding protein [Alcanivorax]KAF0807159.1 hemin importer ATP-binding subunit [Alcanivorax xiamenensis]